MSSIFRELKKRHVLQTAAIYAAVAWAGTEMLGFLLPALNFPRWTITVVAIVFVLGFPVAMFLAWAFEIKADGAKRTDPGSAKGRLMISLVILALLASTTGLFYLIYPEDPALETSEIDVTFNPPPNSIAVLPFENMSENPSNDYFGDGIAEELLNELARNRNLRVTARTSSFQFRDKAIDVRLIGEALNVAKILEGSIRKSGNHVRITVQLIGTLDGYHVWSEIYDRELSDIFKIQEDIARVVYKELNARMTVASRGGTPGSAGSSPATLEAYDFYLRGNSLLQQDSPEKFVLGIELLEIAVREDSSFARAWESLAIAHAKLPTQTVSARHIRDKHIMTAANNALELDASLGRPHALIAETEARRGRWLEAERGFKRGLELEPGNADILRSYGLFLTRMGRIKEAYRFLVKTRELDPAGIASYQALAVVGLLQNQTSVEIPENPLLVKSNDLDWDSDQVLIIGLLRQGRVEQVRELLPSMRQKHGSGFWPDSVLDSVEDMTGVDHASAEIENLETSGILSPARAFLYQVWIGQFEKAYRSAAAAIPAGEFPSAEMWLPELRNFRRDSGFISFLNEIGLPEYWMESDLPDDCTRTAEVIHCD